jgi:3-isopropylmalate/(R)-2-methylmalate dehydratase small subunit
VVAQSFGGIFYRNALNLGLMALVCPETGGIPDGATIAVDPVAGRILLPQQGLELHCEPIPGFLMAMVEDGGLLPHLKKRLAQQQKDKEKTE